MPATAGARRVAERGVPSMDGARRAQVQMLRTLLHAVTDPEPDATDEQRRAARRRKRKELVAEFVASLQQAGSAEEERVLREAVAPLADQPAVASHEAGGGSAAAELLLTRIDEVWRQIDPHAHADSVSGTEIWAEECSRAAARRLLAALAMDEDANEGAFSKNRWQEMLALKKLEVLPLPTAETPPGMTESDVEAAIASGSALRQLLGGDEIAAVQCPSEPPLPRGARALAELLNTESAVLQLALPATTHAEGYAPAWVAEPEKPFGAGANGRRRSAPRRPEHAAPPDAAVRSFGRTLRQFELHSSEVPAAPPPAGAATAAAAGGDANEPPVAPLAHEVELPGGPLVVGDLLTVRLGCPRGDGHWSVATHDATALRQQAPMQWMPHGTTEQLVRFQAQAPTPEGAAAAGIELLLHARGAARRVMLHTQVVHANSMNSADARFDPLKAAAAEEQPHAQERESSQLQQLVMLLRKLNNQQSLVKLAESVVASTRSGH